MSYQQSRPTMGATFIPGGFDDYYMPEPTEVISPAPQRIMPEVPENMQDNLARLELDANKSPTTHSHRQSFSSQSTAQQHGPPAPVVNQYGQQAPPPPQHQQPVYPQQPAYEQPIQQQNYQQQPPQPPQHQQVPPQQPKQGYKSSGDYSKLVTLQNDGPNFSPFPKIPNRSPNVPPSDDEKETILEGARAMVLNSNDPEMQLAWAQDALTYVDAAMCHEERLAETQPARSVTPAVEHQLRIDAMNVVSFLADQHHPRAEFIRGMWLEFGKFGLRVDKKDAFRSYNRAAEKGYYRAEYRMGMQYESTNDPITALIHYKRGADAGDSASLYRLGMMTLLGQHGQPQDFAKGLQLIRQAASSADENAPQGAFVLGMLQARELPQIEVPEIYLPFSEKDARQNIERAAYLGFAKAQLKMGQAYELCTLGCEFNPALSLHYNALAARQGEAEADMAISKWFLCGYEGVFQKNEELAYTYARRAAQQALPTAEFAMGYFNEIGMHVPVNLDKALEWYEKASKNGNKDAQSRIEGISKQNTLSKKDHENVAISKIKSQYGSKKGLRPDRFKQSAAPPVPSLPNIVETSPSVYSQDSARTPQSAIVPPSRLSTTTPYPLDDIPKIQPIERPATVAPYPIDNGPPALGGRPGAAGFFAPDIRSQSVAPGPIHRPGSAFQINPNIFKDDAQSSRLSNSHSNAPLRPYSSIEQFPPRRDSRVPQGRQPQTGGLPSGGYRPATTGPPQDRQDGYQNANKPQLPPLDIGYTAPLDIKKQTRPPPKQELGYQAPLNSKQPGRTGGLPADPRPNQTQGRPVSRPGSDGRRTPNSVPHTNSMPQVPGAYPARKESAQNKPLPQPAQKPAPKPVAKPAKPTLPPGKGPKTFDEMGISQAKKEEDCVVM